VLNSTTYFFYNKRKSAFSLIEVSIVIVIIGLLIIGVIGSKQKQGQVTFSTIKKTGSKTGSSHVFHYQENRKKTGKQGQVTFSNIKNN